MSDDLRDQPEGFGQAFYDFIQKMEREGKIFMSDGIEPDGGILKTFIAIAEFIGTDGDRWVAQVSWGMDGKVPPNWEVVGLLESVSFDLKYHWASWKPSDDPSE